MEYKKISKEKLGKLVEKIKDKDISVVGKYIYNGFSLQISEHDLSGSDRVKRLYHRRRDNGLCVSCGIKVTKKNAKTRKLYRMCEEHREKNDFKGGKK